MDGQECEYIMSKYLRSIMIYGLLAATLFAQDKVSLDWKMHNVGQIRRTESNMGGDLNAKNAESLGYKGMLYCEYPPDSYVEHIGEAGIWVGAVVGGDTCVSVTTSWSSSFEFYPTAEPWDTVWVIGRYDTVDIPYWKNYVGTSDQDFGCRYNDYGPSSQKVALHKPLFIDVIQTSFAWSSSPLDEMIVYTFYIIPTLNDLNNAYIAYWLDANVGYRGSDWSFGSDDVTCFYPDRQMSISSDLPEGTVPTSADGTCLSSIGVKMFTPVGYDVDALKWTYHNYTGPSNSPSRKDAVRYTRMSSGLVSADEVNLQGGTESMMAFGPVNVAVGDTLVCSVAFILGIGKQGVLDNEYTLSRIVEQNFKVPTPPPVPKMYAETSAGQVRLFWNRPNPNDPDPESYRDPYRADTTSQPFEGYRLYKRTRKSKPDGTPQPWTLLAQFDLADNEYYSNTGLEHEFTDYGLLNNIEYYYSITAFSKPDLVLPFPSQESSITQGQLTVVPGPQPPENVGKVAVVPNPYRGDISYYNYNPPWEKPSGSRSYWMEQDRRVQFINLPERCEINIYTVAGDLVETIDHNSYELGYEDWNLTSYVGQAIASGIYLFTAEDKSNGDVQVGKFVIIK